MALDATKVLVGGPDQEVTGAVATAPVGTTLPTDATSALAAAFVDGGYCGPDGLTFSQDYSTADITDWSGSLVRKVLDTFTGEISYVELETGEVSLKRIFGSSYVTKTAPTATAGTRLAVSVGAHMPEEQSWVFNMKDGDNRIRIVVPRGIVSNYDDVQFTHADAISWGVTISCLDDGTGNSIYIYCDNGVTASAASPEITLDRANVSLTVGDTIQLYPTTTPAGETVTWTSSAGTKASVVNGLVTGLDAGTAVITAKITVSAVDYTDTCNVTVTAPSA